MATGEKYECPDASKAGNEKVTAYLGSDEHVTLQDVTASSSAEAKAAVNNLNCIVEGKVVPSAALAAQNVGTTGTWYAPRTHQ